MSNIELFRPKGAECVRDPWGGRYVIMIYGGSFTAYWKHEFLGVYVTFNDARTKCEDHHNDQLRKLVNKYREKYYGYTDTTL